MISGTGSRTIAVAFGSNLGDRRGQILAAAGQVARLLARFRLSTLIETAPVGEGLEHDPPYLNAAGVGESPHPAREIFEALRAVETAAGRQRPYPGAPRSLDLDLILVGDELLQEPELKIPHPRFRDRLFVLAPLAEIAPEMRDPVTGLTVLELLAKKKAGA
ncbi:MAG TPA: 2-amino-4-hydroxy-6-hydroxymethyldihydropteridine diphosphokinase [Vicinamibacterales bacterium]|nr:2-amino-4-hydroxy-6-hydroxymethyldihydropteridine diphosphokinase [Vicinamibacterales bacterium]